MSTKPSINPLNDLPPGMVTPIQSLYDLGVLLVEKFKPADGVYDLVVEYKFGPAGLRLSETETLGAMAVSFGGLGLRMATDTKDKEHQKRLHVQGGVVVSTDPPAPSRPRTKPKAARKKTT